METELIGTFTQHGVSLPLDLQKTANPPVVTLRPQTPKRPLPYDEIEVSVEEHGCRRDARLYADRATGEGAVRRRRAGDRLGAAESGRVAGGTSPVPGPVGRDHPPGGGRLAL